MGNSVMMNIMLSERTFFPPSTSKQEKCQRLGFTGFPLQLLLTVIIIMCIFSTKLASRVYVSRNQNWNWVITERKKSISFIGFPKGFETPYFNRRLNP